MRSPELPTVPESLVCRTVLDLRCRNDKFISQTLLLAAGWHRHCAGRSVLEVMYVGEPDRLVSSFLESISATCIPCAPAANDDFSRSSNKIQGAGPDHAGRRVLLVDNDVCFVGPLDALTSIPASAIAASEAGNLRVTQAQWTLIDEELGLPLIHRRFHPVNTRPDVLGSPLAAEGAEPPEPPERPLYLNSGVILFPVGHDHREPWLDHQRRIHAHFHDHPTRTSAVAESDQAGFATSVAAHGDFAWLPLRFNYRRGCFHLGLEPAAGISILHLTGDVANGGELDISDRIEAYWRKFVWPGIASITSSIEPAEAHRRTTIASDVQAALLKQVRDYDLDELLHAIRRSRAVTA
jgi:hypothetical protein